MSVSEDELQARLDALAKKRADREGEEALARKVQQVADEEAIEALYDQHGASGIAVLELDLFVSGLPQRVAVKCPKGMIAKRFKDQVASDRAETKRLAVKQLADESVAYPGKETYEKLLGEFPGIHEKVAMLAIQLMQGEREAAKKG